MDYQKVKRGDGTKKRVENLRENLRYLSKINRKYKKNRVKYAIL